MIKVMSLLAKAGSGLRFSFRVTAQIEMNIYEGIHVYVTAEFQTFDRFINCSTGL